MQFLLDNDVDTPSDEQQYPVTDLVRTYLQQTGNKFFRIGIASRESRAPLRPGPRPGPLGLPRRLRLARTFQ